MIKKKLLLTFIIIGILPMVLVGQMVFYKAKILLEKVVVSSLNAVVSLKEAEVLLYLESLKIRSKDFAADSFLRGHMEKIARGGPEKDIFVKETNDFLTRHKKLLDDALLRIDLLDLNGKVVASTDPEKIGDDKSNKKYFLKGKENTYVSPSHDQDKELEEIEVSVPVRSRILGGEVLGVLVNHFSFLAFDEMFSGDLILKLGAKTNLKGIGKTGKIYLVDKDRIIITGSSFKEGLSWDQIVDTYPVKKCLEEDQEVSGRWLDYRGVYVVGASTCFSVDDFRVTLLSEQDSTEALAPIKDLEELSLVIVVIIMLFVAWLAFQIAHLIADPIKKLQKSVEIIGSGNLNHKIKGIRGRDEIGQLANSFNKMAKDLQISIDKEKQLAACAILAADIEKKRVAELQEAQKKLEERAVELARSNKELEEFTYVASHDLQEPLRKVKTFGDRLIQKHGEALGERGQDYLRRMGSATSRMQTLIEDLLTYSRVISKAKPFEMVNLNGVIHEVLSDLEVRIEETKAEIHKDDLPTVEADSVQLRQLFQNLISNAIKFNKPGIPPVVEIRCAYQKKNSHKGLSETGHDCMIQVIDNGIGFEEKYNEQIFRIFQRLHGRGKYEGTGVGLAVCRKIVGCHAGHIDVKSSVGQGTTFTITLPVRQQKGENQKEA